MLLHKKVIFRAGNVEANKLRPRKDARGTNWARPPAVNGN